MFRAIRAMVHEIADDGLRRMVQLQCRPFLLLHHIPEDSGEFAIEAFQDRHTDLFQRCCVTYLLVLPPDRNDQ